MRLFRLSHINCETYIIAPTEHHIDSQTVYDLIEEIKLDGELVPLPTLEQLVKMGIAERWDD